MQLSGLLKPEYLLRPRNIAKRLKYRDPNRLPSKMTVAIRGREIRVNPSDIIGRHLLQFGLFDLLVSEAMLRLASKGETTADVGANIGYMSILLAEAVGPDGGVVAFEPHPEIFGDLQANVEGCPVRPIQAAVSEKSGSAILRVPVDFDENRGVASLEPSESGTAIEVQTLTLDDVFPSGQFLGVLKLDIEGHELTALRGADRLLGEKRVRDIVFEDHDPTRSKVASHLVERGYSVFRLKKAFSGPELIDQTTPGLDSTWESPSLLATIDPNRAWALLRPRGWRTLPSLFDS